MSETPGPFSDHDILTRRPPKHPVDAGRPYAFLLEPEHTASGRIEDVATVFLTNRECPFRCLMCDLWKYTTDETVPAGAIPAQIRFALDRLAPARHIKLYNAGSFFDRKAIPVDDHPAIARLLDGFETVIVENHPKLCGEDCYRFDDLITGQLEVALGLETVHPDVLFHLNKRMTLDDFKHAVNRLLAHDIRIRSFILLKPPFLDESEGLEWAVRSMVVAFAEGVTCCSIIPTRAGNGIMESLQDQGFFSPPRLSSMEAVLEEGLRLARGRVFIDLWDAERFAECPACRSRRIDRLRRMNLSQQILPVIQCPACGNA